MVREADTADLPIWGHSLFTIRYALFVKLGRQESNLQLPDSKSGVLPVAPRPRVGVITRYDDDVSWPRMKTDEREEGVDCCRPEGSAGMTVEGIEPSSSGFVARRSSD
jgi:hypothetical protein